jgi:hypothetical protein
VVGNASISAAGEDIVGVKVDCVTLTAAGEFMRPRGRTVWGDPGTSETPLLAADVRLVGETGGDARPFSRSLASSWSSSFSLRSP